MAYDEDLAARVRDAIGGREGVAERRMFGSLGFMVTGNMACGVMGDDLIVRLGREEAQAALAEPGARPFEGNGRRMGGFVVVDASAIADDGALAAWVDAGANHAASLPPK